MTILLAFPSFNISFFLIFVLLEQDSDLSTNRRKTYSLASKTSSEFRDKHFCADNYFPGLLQRTKLCGNDKRVFIIKR